jgi:hypothetical protein
MSTNNPQVLSEYAHRQAIGYLGLMLVPLVYVFAGLRDIPDLTPWKFLDSVSSYYYTGGISIFVGVLSALSVFLFSYPGYKNDIADRALGKFASLVAALVVLFPCEPPDPKLKIVWWSSWMSVVHYTSAAFLFLSFIGFSLFLFPRSNVRKSEDRPPEKQNRNKIYIGCGLIMLGAILWVLINSLLCRAIFLQECIMIAFFAFSWLTKGEADKPILRTAARFSVPLPKYAIKGGEILGQRGN